MPDQVVAFTASTGTPKLIEVSKYIFCIGRQYANQYSMLNAFSEYFVRNKSVNVGKSKRGRDLSSLDSYLYQEIRYSTIVSTENIELLKGYDVMVHDSVTFILHFWALNYEALSIESLKALCSGVIKTTSHLSLGRSTFTQGAAAEFLWLHMLDASEPYEIVEDYNQQIVFRNKFHDFEDFRSNDDSSQQLNSFIILSNIESFNAMTGSKGKSILKSEIKPPLSDEERKFLLFWIILRSFLDNKGCCSFFSDWNFSENKDFSTNVIHAIVGTLIKSELLGTCVPTNSNTLSNYFMFPTPIRRDSIVSLFLTLSDGTRKKLYDKVGLNEEQLNTLQSSKLELLISSNTIPSIVPNMIINSSIGSLNIFKNDLPKVLSSVSKSDSSLVNFSSYVDPSFNNEKESLSNQSSLPENGHIREKESTADDNASKFFQQMLKKSKPKKKS